MVLIFVIAEVSALEWRGVGHEWDMFLGRHSVVGIHIVVWRESWGCVGSVRVAY